MEQGGTPKHQKVSEIPLSVLYLRRAKQLGMVKDHVIKSRGYLLCNCHTKCPSKLSLFYKIYNFINLTLGFDLIAFPGIFLVCAFALVFLGHWFGGKMYTMELQTTLCSSNEVTEVWDFFSRPENLVDITPPSFDLRMLTPSSVRLGNDTIIDFTISPFLSIIPTHIQSRVAHVSTIISAFRHRNN